MPGREPSPSPAEERGAGTVLSVCVRCLLWEGSGQEEHQ